MRFFSLKIRITWCEEERARVCAYAPYAHLYVHMYDNYGKIINNDNKCDAREWKSEMGRVHIMYLHARVMHGCTIRRLSFFFVSSPCYIRNNDQCRNSYAQWKRKKKKNGNREISLCFVLVYHYFIIIFLSLPFFFSRCHEKQNEIYTILLYSIRKMLQFRYVRC